jgi:HEAT repeat protein
LKEILAADPSSEDAYRLFNTIEARKWARMLAREGEISKVIMELMVRGRPAGARKVADKEAITGLVNELDSDDWAKRMAAYRKLAADHGEYTAPYLIERLGSDDPQRRAAAMSWLRKLGTQAVLPLIQALEIDNEMVQAGTATVLGQIGDRRAAPYLLLAATREGVVGKMARGAAARMGASGSANAAMLALAEAYYQRDIAVVDPFRGVYPVWRCIDGNIVSHEVGRDTYNMKLAEEVLYDLLALEPGNLQTRVLLASVLLAQSAGPGPVGTEGEGGPEAALANAAVLAGVGGAEVLEGALRKALADGRPDVATGAAGLLGDILTADTFVAPNALTDALASENKSVRFAAALAIAKVRPRAAFEGSGRVVNVLCEALGQSIVRSVLVIDDNEKTRGQIIAGMSVKGYFASGVAHGAYGLSRLREFPVEDMVIMRYNLGDASVNQIIKMIKEDDRTANVPIVLLCDAGQVDEAKKNYEDKVQSFVTSGAAVGTFEPALRELLPELDAGREAANKLAAAAATALRWLDPRGGPMPSVSANTALLGVLSRADSVRLPAIQALGVIANAASVPGLLAVFGDGTATEEVRGQAAVALGRCARAAGSVSPEIRTALSEAITGEGGYAYMMDLGRAIGTAPFSAAERAQLLTVLRARIKVDTAEE